MNKKGELNNLSNLFKALSDDTRLRILKLLEQGELCVCEIVAALGLIQPKISFHLAVLKDAGLVLDRKEGKWIHYRLDDTLVFHRFLLLSIFERIPEGIEMKDRERLSTWLQKKSNAEKSCCAIKLQGSLATIKHAK